MQLATSQKYAGQFHQRLFMQRPGALIGQDLLHQFLGQYVLLFVHQIKGQGETFPVGSLQQSV